MPLVHLVNRIKPYFPIASYLNQKYSKWLPSASTVNVLQVFDKFPKRAIIMELNKKFMDNPKSNSIMAFKQLVMLMFLNKFLMRA